MEPKKSIFKIALGIVLGVLALAGVCSISGCGGGGGGGSETVSSTTPISEPDMRGLPPDPGKAGKATLAGIDSDGDGVRDDIQRYIAMKYPESAKTRELLTRYAKLTQFELLNSKSVDRALSIQHAREQLTLQQCILYAIKSDKKTAALEDDLTAEYLNTKERSEAYLAYDGLVGSLGADEPSLIRLDLLKQACSYLDALPN